jgi:hypothetical protein
LAFHGRGRYFCPWERVLDTCQVCSELGGSVIMIENMGFIMHGNKKTRFTWNCLIIFVFFALVIFPSGSSITSEMYLDSDNCESIKPTYSEDNFQSIDDISSDINFQKEVPDHFTMNIGQWEDRIEYLAKTSFGWTAMGKDGIYYYVALKGGGHMIKISFHNAKLPISIGLEDCGFETNYFLGNDESKWKTNVRSYCKVLYEDVWPGIDVLYYFKDGELKYDILVSEYAFPSDISFRVEGVKSINVKDNELNIFASEDVIIKDSKLMAYYSDGENVPVAFKKTGRLTFGFQVNKIYGKALIIDPVVFLSSSFLGGSASDQARDMELDQDGNIIILADTMSLDFPNTTGAYQTSNAGSMDIVITKMDPTASYLIFSTFIGGWSYDFPYALDIDGNGDIYATGETWATDFPTTNGTFGEEPPTGSTNVFVVKLSSAGSDLIYSTYVGSTSADWARDIKIFNGDAYVVGYTYSYDFPYVDYPVNNAHGTTFFFILNHNASNLTHTAFWGGFQNEIAYSLDIDLNGDIAVGGITNSKDFPITSGVYQENATDWNNGFLLRYSPSNSTLLFSTYIGGSALDEIRSIYLDTNDDIYFSGMTNNPDGSGDIPFPTTPGAYDRTYNGSKDAFIGKMSSDGTTLIYSTLYGSEGEETVGSIDVDSQGNVYFIGSWDSDVNFTVTPDAFDTTFNQDDDALFAILNAFGTEIIYSTYLGGNVSDLGQTCLLSDTDEILLLGTTQSLDFPSTNGSFQTQNNGGGDLFITKFVLGQYIYLYQGWNLISIPLIQSDTDLSSVLSSISGYYDAVQWYDANAPQNFWMHNHIAKSPQANDLNSLNHIKGFWVHITEPGITRFNYSGSQPVVNQKIPLKVGWNMVGYPSWLYQNRTKGLNNLQFGIDVDLIQWYDTNSQTWHFMEEDDTFVPGRGYWIHARFEANWEVPL